MNQKNKWHFQWSLVAISGCPGTSPIASATIAVSSLFAFPDLKRADDVVRCVLNVVPVTNEQSVAVLSFARPDARLARHALRPILKANGDRQKLKLSTLIISDVENFVLSPEFFDSWSAEKMQKVRDAFISTILDPAPLREDHELLLF